MYPLIGMQLLRTLLPTQSSHGSICVADYATGRAQHAALFAGVILSMSTCSGLGFILTPLLRALDQFMLTNANILIHY